MKEVIRQFGRTMIAAIVCMAMFTFLGKVPAQIGKEILSQERADDSGENSGESFEEDSKENSGEKGIQTDSAAGDTAEENSYEEGDIYEEEYDLQVLTQKLWCDQSYTASDLVRITSGSGAPVSVQVEAVWKETTEDPDEEDSGITCSSTGFCIAGPGCYEVLLSYPAGGRTEYIQVTVLLNRRYR